MADADLAVEALLDFLNAVEAGIATAKRTVKDAQLPDEDFNKLSWQEKEGKKRPYQQTTKQANNNSVLFQNLQEKLKTQGGFWQHDGYNYWTHQQDLDTIDRRRKT